MKANGKTETNPAKKMIEGKKKLLKRLHSDIKITRENAEYEVQRIQSRIRVAQTLLKALERGTLRP